MGGKKAISIDQFQLLAWFHREFRQFLQRPDTRLMVIGYSFSDAHINTAIEEGVEKGLKSWSQESEQDDKWSFCLTAGTLCPANQER